MSTRRQDGSAPPVRVRARWLIEVYAKDIESFDSTRLLHALGRATVGLDAGRDVVVLVHGPLGVNVGAGRYVADALQDARTIEVQVGGRGADYFVQEIRDHATGAEWVGAA